MALGKLKQLDMVLGPLGFSSSRYHLGNTPFFLGESTLLWGVGHFVTNSKKVAEFVVEAF